MNRLAQHAIGLARCGEWRLANAMELLARGEEARRRLHDELVPCAMSGAHTSRPTLQLCLQQSLEVECDVCFDDDVEDEDGERVEGDGCELCGYTRYRFAPFPDIEAAETLSGDPAEPASTWSSALLRLRDCREIVREWERLLDWLEAADQIHVAPRHDTANVWA